MEDKKMSISEIVESEGWKKFTKKLELIGTLIFVIGLIFFGLNIKFGGLLFTLSLSTLAIVYYFLGFNKLKNARETLSNVFYKIYGWSICIALMSILFAIQHWPYPVNAMFLISAFGIAASIILGIRLKDKYGEINKLYFLRPILALAILAFIYLKYLQI